MLLVKQVANVDGQVGILGELVAKGRIKQRCRTALGRVFGIKVVGADIAGRLLAGGDYRWLLPFSALGGAVLLTFSDVAGRLIAHPSELDVGIVTAFIGAPVFIWIVRNRKVGAL